MPSTGAVVGKCLLMPAIAASSRRVGGPPGSAVVVAQVLSWVGDVALLGRGRRSFLSGLLAFLGAHVAYLSAYHARSSTPLLATPGRRRVVAAGAVTAVAMGGLAARTDRALAVPVTAYGVTLATMVAAAAAIDDDRGRDPVLAGATLFLVSDTLIGVRRFVAHDRGTLLETAILSTYAAGQWLIGVGTGRGQ